MHIYGIILIRILPHTFKERTVTLDSFILSVILLTIALTGYLSARAMLRGQEKSNAWFFTALVVWIGWLMSPFMFITPKFFWLYLVGGPISFVLGATIPALWFIFHRERKG